MRVIPARTPTVTLQYADQDALWARPIAIQATELSLRPCSPKKRSCWTRSTAKAASRGSSRSAGCRHSPNFSAVSARRRPRWRGRVRTYSDSFGYTAREPTAGEWPHTSAEPGKPRKRLLRKAVHQTVVWYLQSIPRYFSNGCRRTAEGCAT
jgi:hypothetical protein